MTPTNLTLRFLLEVAALVGLGLWGWSLSVGVVALTLATTFPLSAAIAWGTFNVPGDPSRSGNAPVPVPGAVRLVLELAVLATGAAAYRAIGPTGDRHCPGYTHYPSLCILTQKGIVAFEKRP